jgi:hypothetical protein
MPIKLLCPICGRTFEVYPYRIRNNETVFCCRSCSAKAHKGKNGFHWKGGKVKCVCKTCGKEFGVWFSEMEWGRGKYCSRSCANKGHGGDKSPNWLGGISFEPYCIKFNDTYRNHIRNLFGNECFLCGKSAEDNGRALGVHHVNYNKNCGCDGEKCICVPLCQSCHMGTNFDRDYWQCLIMEMLQPTEAWE